MLMRRTSRRGLGDALPAPIVGSSPPVVANCQAGAFGSVSSLFSAGMSAGFELWKSNFLSAPLLGLTSFGQGGGIIQLADGSHCAMASGGQDAIVGSLGTALITVGPVLALFLLMFGGRR